MSINTLTMVRNLTSTAAYQQRDHRDSNRSLDTDTPSGKVLHGDANNPGPSDSKLPADTADSAVVAATRPSAIGQRMMLSKNERELLSSSLINPDVQMTSDLRAERQARLAILESDLQNDAARFTWWQDVSEKGPKKLETASDSYEFFRIAKDALKHDAESEKPVWTTEERVAVKMDINEQEARVRKNDRWYKKIAWGPTIVWTAIVNMIFN
ncbi:MAG: hypothetical protein Q9166_005671 [cf. Caloplaca sp. 2 TL-2023]